MRDESAEQRRGKTCGVRCCRSDAIQPHNYWLLRNPDKASGRNGVRGYFPSGFSARHPFGRKSSALQQDTQAATALVAACFPAILPQGHGSRIFRADLGNPAGRLPTYAPTVSSLRDRIRFTFGKGTLPRQSDPALRLAAIRVR